VNHYPKGEMCLTCTKLRDNCSALPFDTYPPVKNKLDEGTDDRQVACRARIEVETID